MAGTVSPDWNTHGECGWCLNVYGEAPRCWCADCHSAFAMQKIDDGWTFSKVLCINHMFLCPDCGNKRCPRATSHELDCTQSNEPGQQGSAYGRLPLVRDPQLTQQEMAKIRRHAEELLGCRVYIYENDTSEIRLKFDPAHGLAPKEHDE